MKTIKKNSERGQSLVELAISLVVLLFLLSGVVEFGIAFFQFIQLRDAAQEGALYASLHPNDSAPNGGIETRVRNASQQPIDLTINDVNNPRYVGVIITPVDADGDGRTTCVGDGIRVEVSFKHKVFMPFVGSIFRAMDSGTPPENVIRLTGSVTDTILQSSTAGCP